MKLPFPPAALKQHMVILGKTGAGKSSAMRDIVEYVLEGEPAGFINDHNAQVCIIDPKGDWWGLKTSRNGKDAGFPIAIFGGEHADMPLTPRAGTALAEVVVNAPFPCLIDLGGWMIGERTRFFIDFASTYFKKAKGRRFLFIDEVHNFVPKGKIPDPDTGKMLHWGNRLASEGRGKGITIVAASQRPQKVHNDFLTSMETLVAMRVIHKADRNAYRDWIEGAGDMALGREVLDTVADLKRGSAWVWSPEIKFGPRIVEFPLFATYDSFKPQEPGAKELAGRADVDLESVKKQFAAFVAEAQQNDPAALRKRIAELEAERAKSPYTAEALKVAGDKGFRDGIERVQNDAEMVVQRVREDYLYMAESAADRLRADIKTAFQTYQVDYSYLGHAHPGRKVPALSALPVVYDASKGNPLLNKEQRAEVLHKITKGVNKELALGMAHPKLEGAVDPDSITGLRAKILGALRWLAERGILSAPRATVGALAGVKAGGGYASRVIGELQTAGLIDYPIPGNLGLTHAGMELAPEPPAFNRPFDAWQALVSGLHRQILETLWHAHPEPMTRLNLGEVLGKQAGSGYFSRVVGELQTMKAVYYPTPGSVALTDYVMPP